MDLIDQLKSLSVTIKNQAERLLTEEATKTACVMPFIQALGYNVFDTSEVIPEFTADFGVKQGEKVDYAIFNKGVPVILIECKKYDTNLDSIHASQLYRYFSVVDARIGIITNGIKYRVYTDLEDKNKMDDKPFLEFDLMNISDANVREIKKFSKSAFDIDAIISTAGELKYTKEIKKLLVEYSDSPSEEFVRFIVRQIYSGRATVGVIEQFGGLIRQAFKQFISDEINVKLEAAFADREADQEKELGEEIAREEAAGIITTEEEIEGYNIIRAILREVVDVRRISHKDTKSYFNIIFDGTTHKTICRLLFNNPENKRISLFYYENDTRKESVESISDLTELFKYAEYYKKIVLYYTR